MELRLENDSKTLEPILGVYNWIRTRSAIRAAAWEQGSLIMASFSLWKSDKPRAELRGEARSSLHTT